MPDSKYFLRLGGSFLLGVLVLIIAGILFVLLLPYLLVIGFVGYMLYVAFVSLVIFVYFAMVIGTAIYYIFKPIKVSKKDKGYTITGVKEAGKRQKGSTRKKKSRRK